MQVDEGTPSEMPSSLAGSPVSASTSNGDGRDRSEIKAGNASVNAIEIDSGACMACSIL